MTTDQLRPVPDTHQDAQCLFKLGEQFSRAQTTVPILADQVWKNDGTSEAKRRSQRKLWQGTSCGG